MRPKPHPLAWLPPLALGLAAAVAGELSVAMLLYTGDGFLQALTVILMAQLGGLALGLWSAPTEAGPGWEAVRRRWLLSLLAFTAAAAVAAGWTLLGGFASAGALRGIGLALLAALPLYAVGTVLGALSTLRSGDAAPPAVAAPAALGAAVGAALTGFVGTRLTPVTSYLGCVVLLSAASMVHGRVLDRRIRVRLLASRPSARGEVRVEERLRGRGRSLVVLEGGVPRGGRDDAGRPVRAWEAGVARVLENGGSVSRLLVVGAGAGGLPGLLAAGGGATLAEPNPVVAELVAAHLGWSGGGPPASPCDLLEGTLPEGTWDAVVVDASAWGGREPVPRLPGRTLEAVERRLGPEGLLVLGGVRELAAEGAPARPGLVALEQAAAAAGLGSLSVFARAGDGAGGSDGIVVLRRRGGEAPSLSPPPGWRPVPVES